MYQTFYPHCVNIQQQKSAWAQYQQNISQMSDILKKKQTCKKAKTSRVARFIAQPPLNVILQSHAAKFENETRERFVSASVQPQVINPIHQIKHTPHSMTPTAFDMNLKNLENISGTPDLESVIDNLKTIRENNKNMNDFAPGAFDIIPRGRLKGITFDSQANSVVLF